VEYSSHPILDGDQVRGAVITFVDITERKRAADALQKAKDELELRVAERTRELSGAGPAARAGGLLRRRCAKTNAPALPARCTTSWAACWWR
jgi:hypothetical protein